MGHDDFFLITFVILNVCGIIIHSSSTQYQWSKEKQYGNWKIKEDSK